MTIPGIRDLFAAAGLLEGALVLLVLTLVLQRLGAPLEGSRLLKIVYVFL